MNLKLMEIVSRSADPKKVASFKAANPWREEFCDRYNITLRVQTNKKSRSAIKKIKDGEKLSLVYDV